MAHDVDYVIGILLQETKRDSSHNPEAASFLSQIGDSHVVDELIKHATAGSGVDATTGAVDPDLRELSQYAPTRMKVADVLGGTDTLREVGEHDSTSGELPSLGDGEVHIAKVEPVTIEDALKGESVDESPTQQESRWQPKYNVGDRIVNKHTRREGVIIDISLIARQYIVQYDGDSSPEFASDDDIALPDEFYRPVEEMMDDGSVNVEKAREELTDLLFGNDDEQTAEGALDALKELLTDPEVAPVIIEKMLERGLIDTDRALTLLQKVGAIPLKEA